VLLLCLASLFYLRNIDGLAGARAVLMDGANFIYRVAVTPRDAWASVADYLQSREQLREDNRRLQQENLVLQGKTQQFVAVMAEITRYRALLNSSQEDWIKYKKIWQIHTIQN